MMTNFFTYPGAKAILWIVLTGWLCCFLTAPVNAQDDKNRYNIYEIEAAFIYNFIDFVDWPDHAASDRLVIGILGQDQFGDTFAEVEGTQIEGKTLTVRKSDRLEDLTDSWILFISASEATRVHHVLKSLEHRPILTVSDMDQFTQLGGMIQFYTTEVDGQVKVRFDINREKAHRAGLKISYQLLSLARPKK